MNQTICKSLAAALLALPLLLPAAVGDLYVGEATVGEDQRITRDSLLRALDEVLVRLTGQVHRSPVEMLELGSPELDSLLQSQHLVRHERIEADGNAVTELRARAEFDQQAINQLLRENGLARWGRERPPVLLWAAVEEDASVDLADDPYLVYLVEEQSRRLGLDVVWPLGDVMDMTEVSLPDIRGGFLDSSEAAAVRYGAGIIAMLDLRQVGEADQEFWNARWFWRIQGVDSGLGLTGEAVESVVRGGMERMMADMAARFAVQEASGRMATRVLVVDGIVDAVQFAEVQRYLGGLSIVDTFSVVRASGRQVVFELQLTGEGVVGFLEMGRLLEPVRQTPDGHLHYRLRR